MRKEYCIFNDAKKCDDCGQCDICDLNSNKKCNNCGKCLEMEGIDTKAVKIASVIEDEDDAKVLQTIDSEYINEDLDLDDDFIDEEEGDFDENLEARIDDEFDDVDYSDEDLEYIDDVDGLSEILEDQEQLAELTEEVFPGFYRIRKI